MLTIEQSTDDEQLQKLRRQLQSKDDEIRSLENQLFMANNNYHDLENNYKEANYRASRESERAETNEKASGKHLDEIKKLKLQLANYETTLESSETRLRGLESAESSLEKRLTSSQSNENAIKSLETRLEDLTTNLKDVNTEKARLSEKLIEIENQLMASETHNKKLREEIDDNTMAASSALNSSTNRRDSLSLKELLNSQIDNLKEKLSKSQQDLNIAENQLMALTRSSKREIDQLREQAQEGLEAQENLQTVIAQSDNLQSELDKKVIALENAQNEVRQIQLQLFEEQSKSTVKTKQNQDQEMSVSELDNEVETPNSKSSISKSSNSKLLAEVSRLMAMIHRLRADRDENLGRAHFSETELKFSQELHQKDVAKLESDLANHVETQNELTEALKVARITSNEHEHHIEKLRIDIEQLKHEASEKVESLERALGESKVKVNDRESVETSLLIKLDGATSQYQDLQKTLSETKARVIELDTELIASKEEAQEAKEDLQDWQEHRLTLQEGAAGTIEKLQERLDESRDKHRSLEVNHVVLQDSNKALLEEAEKERLQYEQKIDEISHKFDQALESEHERARFTDSRLTQLTEMSNTLRENFNNTRLKHSEEIRKLRDEHAIELSNMRDSHENGVEDRNRQVENALQLHEDHYERLLNDTKNELKNIVKERDDLLHQLRQHDEHLEEIRAECVTQIENVKREKQEALDDACRKFDDRLIEVERRSVEANANEDVLGETMLDDAQHKAEYHEMEIQYEQRISKLMEEINTANNRIHELENTDIPQSHDTSAAETTAGNSTLKNFFDQNMEQSEILPTTEQTMNSSVGGVSFNNLFNQSGEKSREVVEINDSSDDEQTPDVSTNTILGRDVAPHSENQDVDISMANESVKDYLTDSVLGNEVLAQSEHGLASNQNADNTDVSFAHLFADHQPTYEELKNRISELEQQLAEAIMERDEKLNRALEESEQRIRILYEEFKKAEIENNNASDAKNDHEEKERLRAMVEVIFVNKTNCRLATQRVAELEQQLVEISNHRVELSAEIDNIKSQRELEVQSENQQRVLYENELEQLRQDRQNDGFKLEEVTTLLDKITREYEFKQDELRKLIDSHDVDVENQTQLIENSKQQVDELTRLLEESQARLKGVEEDRQNADNVAYNELQEVHKELLRELSLLKEEREQFDQQLDSSTKLIQEHRVELDALNQNARNEREVLNSQISELNERLQTVYQQKLQLEESLHGAAESETSRKLQEANMKWENDYAMQSELAERRYNEVMEQLEQVRSQFNDNNKLIEEREAEISTLNDALSTQSAALEDVGRLEAEVENLSRQRDEASNSATEASTKLGECHNTIKMKESELEVASQALAALEDEKNSLMDKVEKGDSMADSEELEEARERIQQLETSLESAQQMTEEAEDKCLELEKTVKKLNAQVDRLKVAIKEQPKTTKGASKKDDEPKTSSSTSTVTTTKGKSVTQAGQTKKVADIKSQEKTSGSPRSNAKKRVRDDDDEGEEPQRKNPSQAEASPATRSRKKSEPLSGTPQKRPSLLSKNKAFTPRRHASQPHAQSNTSGSNSTENRESSTRRTSQRQQHQSQISDLRGRLNQFKK